MFWCSFPLLTNVCFSLIGLLSESEESKWDTFCFYLEVIIFSGVAKIAEAVS